MEERKNSGNARNVPTSSVSFVETAHGRLRRQQRGIDKKDLQSAKKYGERKQSKPRRNGDPTAIYTYKGIVYITNEATGEEITSYSVPLNLDYVPIDDTMQQEHDSALSQIRSDMNSWLSNTVMVVDRSGSMKKGDVWGTRSRLDAVWVAVALDYLAHRLETGAACPLDVISIVSLSSQVQYLVREEPASWVLYNRILQVYKEQTFPACGHGPYIPSLIAAENLLTRNSNAACALALCFLSDGCPSDCAVEKGYTKEEWKLKISERVGNLAKMFGRRLTFAAIGIGSPDDFGTLRDMVDAAADFGAVGIFRLPSMTSASLGEAFTSVATSLTTTQSEMTDVSTMKQQKVRNVMRESRKKASEAIDFVTPDEFWIYGLRSVKRTVYQEYVEDGRRRKAFVDAPLQHPLAKYVAMHREAFGEGAERFAYRLYELGADGRTIVGGKFVAKENRLILEEGAGEHARRKFVRKFCEGQQLARRLASEFNQKMEKMRRIDRATSRVTFLDCSVYQLDDIALGNLSVLVEERLDHHKWHKWNANNGYVEGMKSAPTFSHMEIRNAMEKLTLDTDNIIEECSDEEESDEEESGDNSDEGKQGVFHVKTVAFTPSEVAQAFSHFTYLASGRKRLVCDLQGVYDEKENVLKFSDPVIHYHDPHREHRRNVYGKTDQGKKGMAMFFETHRDHCGHLCRLMTGGFKRGPRKQHISS